MRLEYNPVSDDDLHRELLDITPWGGELNGNFIGSLVFGEEFSRDQINVSVYYFTLSEVVDEFIEASQAGEGAPLDDEGAAKAQIIIDDMERMIKALKRRLP